MIKERNIFFSQTAVELKYLEINIFPEKNMVSISQPSFESDIVNRKNRKSNYLYSKDSLSYNVFDAKLERVKNSDFDCWDRIYHSLVESKLDFFSRSSVLDYKEAIDVLDYLDIQGPIKEKIKLIKHESLEEDEDFVLSVKSFLSLLRFYPLLESYREFDLDFYSDSKGFLGATYRQPDRIFNLLFKDNDEVVFSSYDTENAMVFINGTSSFSKLLSNSRKLKRIFSLLEG